MSQESDRFAQRKIKVEITSVGVGMWSIARVIEGPDLILLLNAGWEPYAFWDGVHWLKKKN